MKLPGGRFPLFSLTILLLVLAGCVPVPPQRGDVIGTLRVSGSNVWLNNAPGRDGDQVRIGSTLATGPGSSALLEFRNGGYLQLDENTDPLFEWLEQSKCILIRIVKGQAYLKRERACVEGPNLSLVLNSEANIRIKEQPRLTEVTLVRGSADITSPVQIRLLPAQQFAVAGRGITSLRTLSPAELRAVAAWRKKYRFRPLPTPEPAGPAILFTPRERPTRPTRPAEPSQPGKPEPAQPQPSPTPPSTRERLLDRTLRTTPSMIEIKPDVIR